MTHLTIKYVIFFTVFAAFDVAIAAKKKEIQKAAGQLLEKEGQKYDERTCKSTYFPNIQRLHHSNKVDQAIGCLLKSLLTTNSNAWNWSYLGSLYSEKGEKAKATTCFKQAAKLSGKVSQFVNQWYFIGPFMIGKSEVDGDPIESWGGIVNVSRHRHEKKAAFYSELVAGGVVKWQTYSQTKAGERVQIAPDVNWNELISSLGSLAITEWQGWVVGEFAVNAKGDVSIQCLGVHTFFVDGIFVAADVYRRDEFWFTLSLDPGIHTIYIRLRAKGSQVFSCNIKAADGEPFMVHPAVMVPDIVEDTLMGDVFAIPLTNLQGSKWLKNLRVSLAEPTEELSVSLARERGLMNVAPGQTIPIILRLSLNDNQDVPEVTEDTCKDISLKVKVSAASVKEAQILPVKIRCRKRHESFLFSFLDHDGSVQQAAAIEPLINCPLGQCPVLLTLHGTGVEAQNQADGYKRMEGESWLFGLEKAWVLAPTRHGAHNWEGPGTLTSITALESLHQLMSEVTWMPNKPMTDLVIFAGHSMGGHGAWHLATHYPDRALAVVSLAGWIKKEEYGDSNVFFRHDISTSHTDPATKQVLEACIAENDADRHVSNLQGLPVLTRIGANDRTVHPFFVRRMNRLLKERGINVTYSELAGKEHWWWDTWKTNDGGAVNDPKLRDFTNAHAILPPSLSHTATSECNVGEGEGRCTPSSSENKYSQSASGSGEGGERVTLTVVNPALGEGLRGARVIQQLVPFRTSTIKMVLSNDKAELSTRNVARFSITALRHISYNWRNINLLQIDGILLDSEKESGSIVKENSTHFCKTDTGSWQICASAVLKDGERDSDTYGPARRVAERKFLIVTGTMNEETSATLLHLAVYLANLFLLTSDTVATVIEDATLTVEMAAPHNLIIIGGPGDNGWAQRFVDRVPLGINENGLSLGWCHFSDPQTGALFLAPHREGSLALVLMGNSLQGLEDIMRLASPTIPPMTRSPFSNMVPDYVITGPDFKAKGPGGYECAGFWGNMWDYRLEASSCVC
ncbi:uncharacterized secreted protein ARB_06907 [Strongylocentrotus purpuratus]|uniref:Peptidase S9 prolyl oligopeptidase catalytic domain-containing protein n=1 Tax=Strongylocentrotus purpuratus TaxID=7668 RepID=A0A7M7PS25_STRPU|nr:uncharacterized secreted protein ARB_06907 [Strongylocentrotus purpuratus]